MKITRLIFLVTVILSLCRPAFADDSLPKAKKFYVRVFGDSLYREGLLYAVTDSAIVLANRYRKHTILDTISYDKIDKIKFRRKGSGTAGFLIGAVASLTTGMLIAASVPPGTEGSPAAMAFGMGIILSIPAGCVGLVIGRNSIAPMVLNYDYKKFQQSRNLLWKRSFTRWTHPEPEP